MDFARELQVQRNEADEPTAEELVAILSRKAARVREPQEPRSAQEPYKARPISFVPTRWEIIQLWVSAHRVYATFASVALVVLVGTAYLWRLVLLNVEVDRQWLDLDHALRDRYAMVPAYVECIASYRDKETYALVLTGRALTAWRTARTKEQVISTTATMERVLALLSKEMRQCEQSSPAPDPDQLNSSTRFAKLEIQKSQSTEITTKLVLRYNATIGNFNDKVIGAPGSWIAGMAGLHPHRPIFANGR